MKPAQAYPRVSIRVVNVKISGGHVSVRCRDTRNEGEGRNSKITWINPRTPRKLHTHTHTHIHTRRLVRARFRARVRVRLRTMLRMSHA